MTAEVQGLKELSRAMGMLKKSIATRTAKRALSAGAGPIAKRARKNAPVLQEPTATRKKGTIKKNIRVKVRKRRDGQYEATIWVKGLGKKKIELFKQETGKEGKDNPDDPWYWWFQEFGTAEHPAQPFMRPAFETEKNASLDAIAGKLREDLKKMGLT